MFVAAKIPSFSQVTKDLTKIIFSTSFAFSCSALNLNFFKSTKEFVPTTSLDRQNLDNELSVNLASIISSQFEINQLA